jgi:Predicted lipase
MTNLSSIHSADDRNPYGRTFVWPNSLYQEISQLADISFIMYVFAYLSAAAKKARKMGVIFHGLEVDENSHSAKKPNMKSSSLERNFTPDEIHQLIADNLEFLQEHFAGFGFEEPRLSATYKSLERLNQPGVESPGEVPASSPVGSTVGGSERSLASSASTTARSKASTRPWRAYTIEEFEDKFQSEELVYSLVKDSYHKRITLVFRGSESHLGAAGTNWTTNLNIKVKNADVPQIISGNIADESVGLHEGYYNYIFNKTVDTTDDENFTKYDQIKDDVMGLLKKFPGYKLYVTGHSLGAGLATVAAFYLACEKDLPKPVSCINFASPRVGTRSFLNACQYLEKTCQLRILRVVNDNDTVAVVPLGEYVHAGFQVTLYKDEWFYKAKEPDLYYPNLKLDWKEWLKISWKNSIPASLNIGYVSAAIVDLFGELSCLCTHACVFVLSLLLRITLIIGNVLICQLQESFWKSMTWFLSIRTRILLDLNLFLLA